jgi:DNA-binding NtrC family response regulator
MREGSFRNDLFFRLSTHLIRIPPLRERLDDLPILVDHFVIEAARALKKEAPETLRSVILYLSGYNFPGNIRELQSMIFDAVGRCTTTTLEIDFFTEYFKQLNCCAHSGFVQPIFTPHSRPIWYNGEIPQLVEVEEFLIDEALKKAEGNQTIAARMLGISQSTLSRKIGKETASVQ